ncbi:hypothetical protein DL93DRAFT_2082546 [Clavulina sp. PMI_390]|nr:hypothetical protein DL93DRAFT_2082546 [Clavulina sp. PMI_390]
MSTSSQAELFEQFERYPFDADPIFQAGLQSIVAPLEGRSPGEIEETVGKAKAFYFSRSSGEQLQWSEYVSYRQALSETNTNIFPLPSTTSEDASPSASTEPPQPSPTANTASDPTAGLHGAAAPMSFSAIADLIASGQTHLIPNNEIIPDKLSEDAPSESKAPQRKKPWEREPIVDETVANTEDVSTSLETADSDAAAAEAILSDTA